MSEKTQEQIDAEKAAAKAAEKAAKAEAAAAAKAKRESERAEKKAKAEADKKAKEDAKVAAKAAKVAEKEAAKAAKQAEKDAKVAAKEAAKAAKEAQRQPEQNGIRRPGPDGLCGKVWALADSVSAQLGQPTPIANLLDAAKGSGLNEANVRTEYARWKKFHGLNGRISLPKPAETAPAA